MAKRTKAHAIRFTDHDWARVKSAAKRHNMTPAALVNQIVGLWYKTAWDGLDTPGGKPGVAGRPPKKGGSQEIQD